MLRNAAEYSPPRRGGVDAPSIKWIRSEIGAAGVVSSAKLFRPKHFAELTTYGFVLSRLRFADRPYSLAGSRRCAPRQRRSSTVLNTGTSVRRVASVRNRSACSQPPKSTFANKEALRIEGRHSFQSLGMSSRCV